MSTHTGTTPQAPVAPAMPIWVFLAQQERIAAKRQPSWVAAGLRERGICECCGDEPAATEWAGNGQVIGWACLEVKRAAAAW